MDLVKKEIREALLGDLVPTQDGRLAVSFTRLAKYRNGLGDGYDKVLIFGVMCRRRWYLSTKSEKKMRELAVKGMQDMGRMMHLSSDPGREAVYCSYLLNTPSILTYVRGKDGVIEMTAYSARGFSGWIACFRTLNSFQKKVPEVLQRMSEEDEQKRQGEIREWNAADRLQDKQARKEKKQEKKRLRKEKRKARMEKIVGVLPKLPELPLTEKPGKSTMSVQRGKDYPEKEIRTGQEFSELTEEAGQEAFRQAAWMEGTRPMADTVKDADAVQGTEATVTAAGGELIDSMRAEQARLEAEAEQAKLAARAAQAKLEAAQAKLAAEEAQAKLAEVEARLAEHREKPAENPNAETKPATQQTKPATQQTKSAVKKKKGAAQQAEAGAHQAEAEAQGNAGDGSRKDSGENNRNGGSSGGNGNGNNSGNNGGNGDGNNSRNNSGNNGGKRRKKKR